MLTVCRAASEAAPGAGAAPGARARDVFTTAAAAAREALARTPEQLQVLRDAGVVDAGGRGICVILDAAETALTGRRPMPVHSPLGQHQIPIPHAPPAAALDGDLRADGPAYEVMYLLDADRRRGSRACAPRSARSATRSWSSAARGSGTSTSTSTTSAPPSRPASRRAGRTGCGSPTSRSRSPRPTATGATSSAPGARSSPWPPGPGLEALFAEAGAVVVSGGPGRRPSTGQLLEAITGCGAREVVVLPNDADSVRVARDRGPHRRERRRHPGRGDPDPGPGAGAGGDRRPRAGPQLRPGRPRDDRHRPARPARRGHDRGQAGDDDGRAPASPATCSA